MTLLVSDKSVVVVSDRKPILRSPFKCGLSHKTNVFCDSVLLSPNNTFGVHCGGWVIDAAPYQRYKVSSVMACEAMVHQAPEI